MHDITGFPNQKKRGADISLNFMLSQVSNYYVFTNTIFKRFLFKYLIARVSKKILFNLLATVSKSYENLQEQIQKEIH